MPATKEQTNKALRHMLAQVGKPYIWGGTGPEGFDCSGLAWKAFKRAGVSIPRTTYTMMNGGRGVGRSEVAPGDGLLPQPGHIVWYIGHGNVVEAYRTGTDIRVRRMKDSDGRYAVRRFGTPGDPMTVDDAMIMNASDASDGSSSPVASIQKLAEPLAAFAETVTDKFVWIRILMFAAGLIMILLGGSFIIGGRLKKVLEQ